MLPTMTAQTASDVLDAFMLTYRMRADGQIVDKRGRLAPDRSLELAERAVRVLAGAQ